MTTLDGIWLTESARLKLLADEEHEALGLDVEYRNAITSMHRIDSSLVTTMPGEAETPRQQADGKDAQKAAAVPHTHPAESRLVGFLDEEALLTERLA